MAIEGVLTNELGELFVTQHDLGKQYKYKLHPKSLDDWKNRIKFEDPDVRRVVTFIVKDSRAEIINII